MKNVQDVEEQAVNSSANFWFTAGGLYVEHCLQRDYTPDEMASQNWRQERKDAY